MITKAVKFQENPDEKIVYPISTHPLNPSDISQESMFWGSGDGFKPKQIKRGRKLTPRTDKELKQQVCKQSNSIVILKY